MRSENAISRGFIFPDGTIARKGTQHDDIAMEYLNDYKLYDEYLKSQYHDLCDYMVFGKGAIKVGCNKGPNPKIITFVEEKMTREQWVYIEYYQSKGYELDRIKM